MHELKKEKQSFKKMLFIYNVYHVYIYINVIKRKSFLYSLDMYSFYNCCTAREL